MSISCYYAWSVSNSFAQHYGIALRESIIIYPSISVLKAFGLFLALFMTNTDCVNAPGQVYGGCG